MRHITVFWLLLGSAILLLMVAACENDSTGTSNDKTGVAPEILASYPDDGAVGVPVDTNLWFRFNMSMDTASFRHSFNLAGGEPMYRWMDSLGHHMGPHGMTDMDHMMNWLDSINWHGDLHWNQERDSCWFAPDSMFRHDTDYMIYIRGDVRGHNGGMMNFDTTLYGGLRHEFHTEE